MTKSWCKECNFWRYGDCEHTRTVGASMNWLPFEFEQGRKEFGGKIWIMKRDVAERLGQSRIGMSYSYTLIEWAGGLDRLRAEWEEDR